MLCHNTKTRQYSRFNLFIRSFLFWLYSTTTIILYSFVVTFSILLPLRARFWLIDKYLVAYMWVLAKLCHITYEIHGVENIPKDKAVIVLSKHQSTWETFILPRIFPYFSVIAKRELLWLPFFGWGLYASDPITINRKNKASAMQQIITKGKIALEAGRSIIIFPEGTRIPYGSVGHYRLGGARLSSATGFPIIPVAHDAGRYWPKRQFIKKPGVIHLFIGPPIDPKDKTPEEILALTKHWIEEKMTYIHSLVDKPTG